MATFRPFLVANISSSKADFDRDLLQWTFHTFRVYLLFRNDGLTHRPKILPEVKPLCSFWKNSNSYTDLISYFEHFQPVPFNITHFDKKTVWSRSKPNPHGSSYQFTKLSLIQNFHSLKNPHKLCLFPSAT
jgi:hypothetical protein